MLEIVTTNKVASDLPEWRLTATQPLVPKLERKSMIFLIWPAHLFYGMKISTDPYIFTHLDLMWKQFQYGH